MNTDNLKQKLETEKNLLESELASIGQKNPDNPADWQATPAEGAESVEYREEVADRLEEGETREATMVPLEARLAEVKAALDRMASGTYGTCELGGEPIEEARLEANPAARTCTAHMNDDAADSLAA